jgi:chemotaxis signal transduction protein
MDRLHSHMTQGSDVSEELAGIEYLLFSCRQTPCAAPLHELREVLPSLPRTVHLPFSPPWLLGIFTLRTELLGLVDPAPALLSAYANEPATPAASPTTALIVGEGDTLLGLAVTGVGDIALVLPDQLLPISASGGRPQAGPYMRARYVPASGGPEYAVLDLPRLVTDLLRMLTEGAEHG